MVDRSHQSIQMEMHAAPSVLDAVKQIWAFCELSVRERYCKAKEYRRG